MRKTVEKRYEITQPFPVGSALVLYGFASCLFIGSEKGFVIPGSFAYRVSMSFLDKATYYDAPVPATIGGCISFVLCFAVMFLVGLLVFSHKKKIEN